MAQIIKKHKILLAIVFLGFLLRLFQLGNDILWYDEVGVFGVTKAKNLEEIISIVRSHVMAMPMDYFITWLVSHLGTSNAILRFPSVVWGTLTLPVCYFFFKELSDSKSALFGTLLLAISPFHIQYSQELRFYASLTFFYILSTYLLFQALKNPGRKQWLIFTIVTTIGIYFHMYVLLVLATALIWFLFGKKDTIDRQKVFRSLELSSLMILLAFAIGFYTFSGRITLSNPFLETGITFAQTLFVGLGWLPYYSYSPELSWGWGLACLLLQVWGMVKILENPRSPAVLLLHSILIQMIIIIGLDIWKKYYFMPKQFICFLPILMFIAGLAVSDLNSRLSDLISITTKWKDTVMPKIAGSIILIVAILLLNFPAQVTYFRDTKGNANQITDFIYNTWHPGNIVLVTNPYEAGYYNYFFAEVIKDETIIPSVWQADWNTIQDSTVWSGKIFVITPIILTNNQTEILNSSGYKLVPLNYEFSRNSRYLWVKENGSSQIEIR